MEYDDEYFMRQAVVEAAKSQDDGEVPVGAVLVSKEKIICRAHNETLLRNDPTAHAEIIAIRKACQIKNNYRILNCTLYVTLEPCAMCLGAAIHARIKKLVFGAFDPKSGAVESVMSFPLEKMNHFIEIKGGILGEECGKILKDFFRAKR